MKLLRWLALLPGRKVTVYLIDGSVRRGRVWTIERRNVVLRLPKECSEAFCNDHGPTQCVRERSSEGVSWCRGWSGPAVDALQVALALH